MSVDRAELVRTAAKLLSAEPTFLQSLAVGRRRITRSSARRFRAARQWGSRARLVCVVSIELRLLEEQTAAPTR
jgi:hypothetical protein